MPSSDSTPVASPKNQAREQSLIEALLHLAELLNTKIDPSLTRRAAARAVKDSDEPLESLVIAGEIVGIRIQACRERLSQVLWRARNELPLVMWQAKNESWVVVRQHSFFRGRVSFPEKPAEPEVMTRKELARRMGIADASENVDVGIVSLERPAEGLRGTEEEQVAALLPSYHDHQADSHVHHHVSPERRYWGLMKPELRDAYTILVFSIITGLLQLAVPLSVNALVSNLAFGSQSTPFIQALLVIALAVFGFLLLSAIIRGMQYYVAEVIQRRLFVRVAADLAYRLPRVKADSIDGVHAPEMVNRFLDVVTVQKSTALLLMDGGSLVLSSTIGMVILAFYHPFLLSFTLLLLLALGFIIFGLGRSAVRTSINESIAKYDVVNWLEELARYPRLFKGPGGYALAMERADQLARRFLLARNSHFKVLMRQISGLLMLEVLAASAVLILGGWLVLSMQLTLGQLVAAELIVSGIIASIAKLGKQFEAWYDAMAAVDKLGHLIDLEIETEDGEMPELSGTGLSIKAVDAGFAYPDGREVFSGLSFDIPAGGRVALMGAQGAGSSTLLDMLLGLRHPSTGHLQLGGFDLRSWYLEKLRASVMLVRSEDIVNGTIAENIRLGHAEITLAEVQEALQLVGLLDDVLCLPLGMHTALVTGGLPLSSRQRVRLLLARALVLKPRLLLLDDVFDGMDPISMNELSRVMLSPVLPWTVVIATHDASVAAKCSQCIDLDNPSCHLPSA